ncbi:hypothetical protein [Alicyclobacillus dauci]|uniref:Uncharacterized protein n=1 Tax=Alicyclobacillus dauci TaxID=1475485 RepID=A0ABY6Z7F0_9BACL|nr:hypothetical protein [Alicyclobacillus dauci]WAH38196.1 hypothetical protein NZD86_06845 [Alicyclobacillus dauci]
MNEIGRLNQQIQQMQQILSDMQQTLNQLETKTSYGSRYARASRINPRVAVALEEQGPPRQSEFAEYARQPFYTE